MSVETASGFAADEGGNATIEFVLWVPVFMAILMIVAEYATVFMTHASMYDAARDGARRIATGTMSAGEVERLLPGRVHTISDDVRVAADDGAEVVVEVATPIAKAGPFGFAAGFGRGDLVARVTMLREPI